MDGNELTGRVKGISTKSKADEDGAIEHTTKVGIELKDLDKETLDMMATAEFEHQPVTVSVDKVRAVR